MLFYLIESYPVEIFQIWPPGWLIWIVLKFSGDWSGKFWKWQFWYDLERLCRFSGVCSNICSKSILINIEFGDWVLRRLIYLYRCLHFFLSFSSVCSNFLTSSNACSCECVLNTARKTTHLMADLRNISRQLRGQESSGCNLKQASVVLIWSAERTPCRFEALKYHFNSVEASLSTISLWLKRAPGQSEASTALDWSKHHFALKQASCHFEASTMSM